MLEKWCNGCEQMKRVDKFHRCSSKKDGLHSLCKSCRSKNARAYRQSEEGMRYLEGRCEERKEYNERYFQSESGKAALQRYRQSDKCKATRRRYKRSDRGKEINRRYLQQALADHPEKFRARSAVNNAVACGKLPHVLTQDCECCAEQAEHYHHPDYDFPLDVVPLCRDCHDDVHDDLGDEHEDSDCR